MRKLLREKYDSNLGLTLRMYLTENGIQYATILDKERPVCPICFQSPIYVHMSLTDKCNLKCPYCYASDGNRQYGDMPLDDVLRLISLFDEKGVFAVTWTGGEPFCHPSFDTIFQKTHSLGISQSVLTNGTCIPDGFIENNPCDNVLYQFSLNSAWHPSAEDEKNHKLIYKNIQRCRSKRINNIVTILLEPATASMIDNLVKELIDNGVSQARFGYFMPIGRGDGSPFNEYLTELEQSIPYYAEIRNKYKKYIRLFYQFDTHKLEPKPIIPERFSMCEAGTSLLYIDNNGEVYPCPLFKSSSIFRCGNVFETPWEQLWNAEPMNRLRNISACDGCEQSCRGWCRALKFYATNSLDGVGAVCNKLILNA